MHRTRLKSVEWAIQIYWVAKSKMKFQQRSVLYLPNSFIRDMSPLAQKTIWNVKHISAAYADWIAIRPMDYPTRICLAVCLQTYVPLVQPTNSTVYPPGTIGVDRTQNYSIPSSHPCMYVYSYLYSYIHISARLSYSQRI